MKVTRTAVALVLLLVAIKATDADASPRADWRKVVKKCAGSDLIKNNVIYTGATDLGALTVFKRVAGGNLQPHWLPKAFSDAGLDLSSVIFSTDPVSDCVTASKTKFSGSASATLKGTGLDVSGSLGASLSRAKNVEVSIKGFRWDRVLTGPLEKALKTPGLSQIANDLQQPGRYLALNALRVFGFSADLEFDGSVAAEINPHFSTASGVGPAEVEGNVKAEWTGKRTLRLTVAESANPFVIAMTPARYSPAGVAAGGASIKEADLDARSITVVRQSEGSGE